MVNWETRMSSHGCPKVSYTGSKTMTHPTPVVWDYVFIMPGNLHGEFLGCDVYMGEAELGNICRISISFRLAEASGKVHLTKPLPVPNRCIYIHYIYIELCWLLKLLNFVIAMLEILSLNAVDILNCISLRVTSCTIYY